MRELNLVETHNLPLSLPGTFVTDALRTEEEPLQLDDERAVLEWAQREATNLGLMSSDQPSTSK